MTEEDVYKQVEDTISQQLAQLLKTTAKIAKYDEQDRNRKLMRMVIIVATAVVLGIFGWVQWRAHVDQRADRRAVYRVCTERNGQLAAIVRGFESSDVPPEVRENVRLVLQPTDCSPFR